jgi:hypothetical protein
MSSAAIREWENALSHNGRLMEHAMSALEHVCVFRSDCGEPAILRANSGAGSTGRGIGDLVSALRWASVVVEQYGSRSHELVQLVCVCVNRGGE